MLVEKVDAVAVWSKEHHRENKLSVYPRQGHAPFSCISDNIYQIKTVSSFGLVILMPNRRGRIYGRLLVSGELYLPKEYTDTIETITMYRVRTPHGTSLAAKEYVRESGGVSFYNSFLLPTKRDVVELMLRYEVLV